MVCPGCQNELPEMNGPTHPYMLSSPACWRVYGELLAREYSDQRLMTHHRLTVDAYAVQHPGVDVPAARRSVAVHLSRMYLLLERAWPMARANACMLAISASKDARPWLPPPSMQGTRTVVDVPASTTPGEHGERVLLWARSVWHAWEPHHRTVAQWCATL